MLCYIGMPEAISVLFVFFSFFYHKLKLYVNYICTFIHFTIYLYECFVWRLQGSWLVGAQEELNNISDDASLLQ